MKNQVSCEVGGCLLTIETGHMARQASGSVVVHYGETVVLVTATAAKEKKEGIEEEEIKKIRSKYWVK